jgi:flagellar biogenesis protein FliO
MKVMTAISRHRKGFVGLGAILMALLLVSLWTGGAAQQQPLSPSGGEQAPASTDLGMGGMALRVMGSVALLIGILYAAMYVMRALSGKGVVGRLKQDTISVLHKRHIAPKKSICVVKIGSKAMVIGVTDSQISHLGDLSEEELESIKVEEPSKAGEFKRQLLGFTFGIKGKG